MSDFDEGVAKEYPTPTMIWWKQGESERDTTLEIKVPIDEASAAKGVRARDMSVEVKDSEILCVKHKGETMVQWRLFQEVQSEEVQWELQDTCVDVELQKKEPTAWPCLLNLPMASTDKALLNAQELDQILRTELKPLPANKVTQSSKQSSGDGDPDDILDDALDETEAMDPLVEAELRGLADEREEIEKTIADADEQLQKESTSEEEKEQFKQKLKLLVKMKEVLEQTTALRTQPSTLESFRKAQRLDIYKMRLNQGELDEEETEHYSNDQESAMTAHELFRRGNQLLQEAKPKEALHMLRLAAIRHKHPFSAITLFGIYSEVGLRGKAAYFLFNRANDNDNIDPITNQQMGELHEKGLQHFPSLFTCAVCYYQRAACRGSSYAMMCLAHLFQRGCCSGASGARRTSHANEDRFRLWLTRAAERGSGAAYYVIGNKYLRGENGYEKSYDKAKKFLDGAVANQPSLGSNLARAELEALRVEQKGSSSSSPSSSPTSSASKKVTIADGAASSSASGSAGGGKIDVRKKLSSLQQQQRGGSAKSNMEPSSTRSTRQSAASGAKGRAFWEKATTVGITTFALYTLLFPIRAMFIPHFYMAVQTVKDMVGASLGGLDGGEAMRGGLL